MRLPPKHHGGWRLRQPPLRRAGEAAPVRAWRPSRRVRQWHERPGVPPIVRDERREAGPVASTPFGSPRKAEAFRGSPSDPRLEPKLRGGSPWIPASAEAFAVLLRIAALAEASATFLLDPCAGRSLCRFPGAPFGPKPWRLSRIPAWAEALAVHRSVPRVRPKPWRFTCPEAPYRPKPICIFRPESLSA